MPAPRISIRELTKRYDDKPVLNGIDLEVPAGQVFGYIGPNGAGKTTTVKILVGMLGGYTGRVEVCGYDVAREPLEVKKRIGYIPESAALYEALTPMEYFRFMGEIHGLDGVENRARGRDMLALLGMEAEIDDRIASFSKGMRQKVMLVAGLLHDPQVVFMDEPLSGLDASSALIVKEMVALLAERGKTVFYCSHVMDVVERVCDRIAILSEGRIATDGTFEELQASNKGETLEHIFTQLTSEGRHREVAEAIVDRIERERA